jgi:hypothetical protein
VIPLLVTGYSSAEDNSFRPAEYYQWGWDIGMGDILTTVDDMLKWDEALYTEKLVKRDLLEKAWSSYVLADGRKANYGYGWWVSQYQGLQIIEHGGGISGFRSESVRIPTQHIFVVVLSNNEPANIYTCGILIGLRVAGKTLAPPPAQTVSSAELKEYTGVYDMLHYFILSTKDITREKLFRKIMMQDTALITQRSGGGKTPLLSVGKDLFVAKGSSTYFRFRRDNNGRISALESYSEPVAYGPVQIAPKTDLPLPKEKVPISLDEKTLKAFAGRYNLGGEHSVRVRVEGSRVFMEGIGEILPESGTRFFAKDADVTIEFLKNLKGVVTGVVYDRAWRYEGKKVE